MRTSYEKDSSSEYTPVKKPSKKKKKGIRKSKRKAEAVLIV